MAGKCYIALFTIQLIKWVMLLLSIYLPFATLDNSVHSYTSCCGKPIKHVIVFAINHIKYYINICTLDITEKVLNNIMTRYRTK